MIQQKSAVTSTLLNVYRDRVGALPKGLDYEHGKSSEHLQLMSLRTHHTSVVAKTMHYFFFFNTKISRNYTTLSEHQWQG